MPADAAGPQPAAGDASTAAVVGRAAELEQVDAICARGAGADEQRRTFDEAGSLLEVAKRVAETTVSGL